MTHRSIILTSSGKDLPVSAGVQTPAEMPRSGNEVYEQVAQADKLAYRQVGIPL